MATTLVRDIDDVVRIFPALPVRTFTVSLCIILIAQFEGCEQTKF